MTLEEIFAFVAKTDYGETFHQTSIEGRKVFGIFQKATAPFFRPSESRNRENLEYAFGNHGDPFKFATDNLLTFQMGFRVTRNIFFYEKMRETFQRLFECGLLLNFSPSLLYTSFSGKFKPHEKQAEYSTLTWDQLYPGFFIWLGASIACIIVFLGEIVVFNVQKLMNKTKVTVVNCINKISSI